MSKESTIILNGNVRRLAMAGAALICTLIVGACAGDAKPATTATAAATFNDADVTFAQHMIVHHRQAVTMATLAASSAGDIEIRQLASFIKNGQQPEIEMLTRWLTSWGRPAPGADVGPHDEASMPGMMTPRDMSTLRTAKGAAFDKRFATMMIAHHDGAMEMARHELTAGLDTNARALAEQIILTQRSEVDALRRISSRL